MLNETVTIHDDRLVINNLTVNDPDIVEHLREATNKEQELRTLLLLGVRAADVSRATLDANLVERRFEEIATRMQESVDNSVSRVAAASNQLLDEDTGALTMTLTQLRTELESMLTQHFDPNSRKSVMASVETMLTEAAEQQQRRLQQVLANGPNAPLGAVKAEILDAVNNSNHQLRGLVEEISRTISVHKAEEQVSTKVPGKGFKYEELLLDRLQHLAAPSHDVPEKVGGTNGIAGNKKGDLLLTYAALPTQANPRVAIEAKCREVGMKAIREELEQAIENRDAGAGLAVFSSQEQAPTQVPFHIIGDTQAIVVFDPDSDNDAGLQLAYLWARWVLQRSTINDQVEHERIRLTIQRLTETLTHMSSMKKANKEVATKTDFLSRGFEWFTKTIQEQVDELSSMLAPKDIAA